MTEHEPAQPEAADAGVAIGAPYSAAKMFMELETPARAYASGTAASRTPSRTRNRPAGDAEKSGVYVLDEPTTGLHLAGVEQLLGLLDRLVDSGKPLQDGDR